MMEMREAKMRIELDPASAEQEVEALADRVEKLEESLQKDSQYVTNLEKRDMVIRSAQQGDAQQGRGRSRFGTTVAWLQNLSAAKLAGTGAMMLGAAAATTANILDPTGKLAAGITPWIAPAGRAVETAVSLGQQFGPAAIGAAGPVLDKIPGVRSLAVSALNTARDIDATVGAVGETQEDVLEFVKAQLLIGGEVNPRATATYMRTKFGLNQMVISGRAKFRDELSKTVFEKGSSYLFDVFKKTTGLE